MASSKPHPPLLDQVLVEDNSFSKTLILNRPKQLNALSHQMVSRLFELFLAYEKDPNVKLLLLKGNGRAFCAGGDVAAVVRDIREAHWKSGAEYFRKEFTLNYIMATYTKPQVSILDGIVMGGGAGASIHGRFRVATENSVFAMPETALGLFPDVGASYYLSRLPGFFGEYVGLTGARLDGAEMLLCGLATHLVPSAKLPLLEKALVNLDSSDPARISAIIDEYSERPYLKGRSAYHWLDVIDKCFSLRTVEAILSALEKEAVNITEDWFSAAIQSLKKASPTSLKISLKSIREGRLQGVGQCLVQEFRMVCHVMQGKLSKDFFEGCRAILLDKDKNPKWEPSQLDLISEAVVEEYFSKVDDEEWEELKLPARFNLPGHAIAKL
ncbi:PREDICTED: 3-hydroxyisobutyryl-CoA hydrolase 1-like [Populus euphratica]|uniref:3-hydroxyisobutyryl-CoA hydrolase n=1 Tax=Populus euphratica TaxID=75702 RepID=A0AAJ6X9J8_POPEU|nr:PREDICTED: 3-hydroxyisobutyryl-CoA hydrolase 1-like [Populus euphratica]